MAKMIPATPNNFTPESHEGDIFNCLKKLSDEYYVFHSFSFIDIKENTWKEREADFVIFHEKKGILCIESKAGQVSCVDGQWFHGDGREMRDPFKQANDGRWLLNKKIEQLYGSNEVLFHCKMLAAVWFPTLQKAKLSHMALPQNADPNLILTADDIDDPTVKIEQIFDIHTTKLNHEVDGQMTASMSKSLLNNILCPLFKVLPSKTAELDYKNERFDVMLKEQYALLDYLEEQRSAVINGAAGTGKTMLALEKARRHSEKGESVLFLCFNSYLKDYLSSNYSFPKVEYYTIDGFACKVCNTIKADFDELAIKLIEMDEKGIFPYQHIIIDEGQDMGQERIEESEVLVWMQQIMEAKPDGTFYLFYDKLQLIQSATLPKVIQDADCKLTLYRNCRNTRRIATTSFKPLFAEPRMFDSAFDGELPSIAFVDETGFLKALDMAIKDGFDKGITNIQIVSCVADGCSQIKDHLTIHGKYMFNGKEIPFTTCRKFKGLEADMVVLTDVSNETLHKDKLLFYVGASRAKVELSVICNLTDSECTAMVEELKGHVKRNQPKQTLAKLLGCRMIC